MNTRWHGKSLWCCYGRQKKTNTRIANGLGHKGLKLNGLNRIGLISDLRKPGGGFKKCGRSKQKLTQKENILNVFQLAKASKND